MAQVGAPVSPLAYAMTGGYGMGGMMNPAMMGMGMMNPAMLQNQARFQLGSQLQGEGVSSAPVYSPWQGLSKLAGVLVGKKLMDDAYGNTAQAQQETPEHKAAMVKLLGGPGTPAADAYLNATPFEQYQTELKFGDILAQQSQLQKTSPTESVSVGASGNGVKPNPLPTQPANQAASDLIAALQSNDPLRIKAAQAAYAKAQQEGNIQYGTDANGNPVAQAVPGAPAGLAANAAATANAQVPAHIAESGAKAAQEGAQTRLTNLTKPEMAEPGAQRIVPPQTGVAGGGGGGYSVPPVPSAAAAPASGGFPSPKPIAPTAPVASGTSKAQAAAQPGTFQVASANGPITVPTAPGPVDADGNPLAEPVNAAKPVGEPASTTAGQPPIPEKPAAPTVKTTQLPGGGTVTQYGTNASTFQPLIEEDTKELMADRENAAKGQTDMATARSIMQFLPRVRTGWGAPEIQDAGKILAGLGVSNEDVARFTGTNPAMGDYLTKQFLNLSMGAARNMGAREPGSVIQMFSKAYPNLGTTQEALQLQSNAIYMDRLREQDLANAKTSWLNDSVNGIQSSGGYRGLKGFNEEFNKTHSAESYLYGAEAMSGHPEAWRMAKTPEEQDAIYALIPSGTAFLAPDGQWRTKP